jgi:hypothetical protein
MVVIKCLKFPLGIIFGDGKDRRVSDARVVLDFIYVVLNTGVGT